ncbi:MAG: response regulator [Thermodesulfobacteriota bacterium]
MSPAAPCTILLVEDNPADVTFFEEALADCQIPARLQVVEHGLKALQVLRRQGAFAAALRPDVVVLDLNLPVMNGREVLAAMMADPDLRDLPVVVLSTSVSDHRVIDLCPPGHCLYFSKTDDFGLLQEIVRQIIQHATAGHPALGPAQAGAVPPPGPLPAP